MTMEFRNLTPLHAMAFNAVDVPGNEIHVVALKAAYRLEPTQSHDSAGDTHRCVLLSGDNAVSLAMADEYEGETGTSSVKWESDLAPFKPKCDVLVRATAYAPHGTPAAFWPVRVRVFDDGNMVVDKGLRVTGPRSFTKGWRGWKLGDPQPATAVPVRWEQAYGGASRVTLAPGSTETGAELQLNEVCFTKPLGRGWVEKRFLDRATHKSVVASPCAAFALRPLPKVAEIPAPQVEAWDIPIAGPDVVEHSASALDTKQMKEVAAGYAATPVGLGVVGRAWTPRLQFAGTYDETWRKTRWPYHPVDHDFHYWNGAPADQQIAWPAPGPAFELANLALPDHTHMGFLRARLPGHRALVALRFESGAIVPLEMKLDTLLIDTEEMRVLVTWRAVFPLEPAVRVCEARFELDRHAPLLRMPALKTASEPEGTWQTT
ncbi:MULTISPECIES: DUF2169 family type VI secretion system accessory protein [Burkholderia]|jgi:hypothetical protein|uniref:DUF2169 family type VI secretion system accessory protein n=1 Tax=Burkholderia TaxID=32008 RepID=UPI00114D302D|nr:MULTISPECIES: DUF2169 domain-containing protein [Burkholderia]MBA9832053.1 DUF2169 domain-containing protein [Burkholderia contaminans]MBA9839375.1 DUF2169 domain-containing protein [Burkholderia contaminans]MBA9864848.1 DUF2169 domain-containing protein [Burkholderia contaminans]MBA9906826.1 DUF2169 domain-containing protein [Burkholderia contaminans]MBA9930710.1 DUF2169 domain-containing protein [Burkholderia contaminans]